MQKYLKTVLILVGLTGVGEVVALDAAMARGGGGGNFMNSPGYQRRLQESRGYVTNRSNSVATPPYAGPVTNERRIRRRR